MYPMITYGMSRRGLSEATGRISTDQRTQRKQTVMKRTASDRFSRSLRRIREWCSTHRHLDVEAQHRALAAKMRGHYAYFGVTSNSPALSRFAHEVRRIWRKWLSRRSQRSLLTWGAMDRLLERFPLPPPRIVHRYGT